MKIIVINILCLFLFTSCAKEEKTEIGTKTYENEYPFRFVFPDTVVVDKKYNGKILYNSKNDSITTKVAGNGLKSRHVLYIYSKVNEPFKDFKEVYANKGSDTIMALQTTHIDLINFSFSETGIHYIDGIISDQIFSKKIDNRGRVNISKSNILVGHKVVVIDSL